jgi:hypothetical protein
MSIKENENQIYTKEQNDYMTLYLKNIIERYFDLESNASQAKKEAIIIQAFTRVKEILNAKEKKFVICVNEKSGEISLDISDLKGQEKFEKNTAFNKNFCQYTSKNVTQYNNKNVSYSHYGVSAAGRIVEGDDDRLSDARIPLYHAHEIYEIEGLQNFIEKAILKVNSTHLHSNFNIIDKIIYTGSMAQIDLRLLEDFSIRVEKALECIQEIDESFVLLATGYMYQLKETLSAVIYRIQELEEKIDTWIKWLEDSKNYTDWKNKEYKNEINTYIKQFLSKEEYDRLEWVMEHSIRPIYYNEINLSSYGNYFELIDYESVQESVSKGNYGGSPYNLRKGFTKIALEQDFSGFINNDAIEQIGGSILNGFCSVHFEYDKNGHHYCDELPQLYQLGNSQHDCVLIDCNWDSYNAINIYAKRISYIPVFLYRTLILRAKCTDHAGNVGDDSVICIDNFDTKKVFVDYYQHNNKKKLTDSFTKSIDGFNKTVLANAIPNDNNNNYHDRVKVSWNFTEPDTYLYFYKLYKKGPYDSDWIEVKHSNADSAITSGNLLDIYNAADVIRCGDGTDDVAVGTTVLTGEDRYIAWNVENGVAKSNSNTSCHDIFLTQQKYIIYRHRCTFTIFGPQNEDPEYDNDAITTIISAVKDSSGKLHTLSLVCSKSSEGIVRVPVAGFSIVYNYCMPGMKFLATHAMDVTNPSYTDAYQANAWTEDNKINIDVRKDRKNIYIYSSEFYQLDGFNFDESKTDLERERMHISLSSIKAQTGIDFTEGSIGYGNCSQYGATVIGIDVQIFKSRFINQYIDKIQDTDRPNPPKMYGTCIENSETQDVYDVTVQYSDYRTETQYKLQLFDDVNFAINGKEFIDNLVEKEDGLMGPLTITSFSGVKNVDYTIGYESNYPKMINPFYSPVNSDPDSYVTVEVVSRTEGSYPIDKLKVTVVKKPYENEIIFCDNDHISFHNYAEKYYGYNCELLSKQWKVPTDSGTSTKTIDAKYICTLLNPTDLQDHIYHVKNSYNTINDDKYINLGKEYYIPATFEKDVYDGKQALDDKKASSSKVGYFKEIFNISNSNCFKSDIDSSYGILGMFRFLNLNYFFKNAKFSYRVFKVPGKENQ